ncbi:MAG TPA: hypothetical protein VD907_03210 [Verrucomicrobiae bacterium]|nr:hypothetical protein [Verrucomicrobiae bacterium]
MYQTGARPIVSSSVITGVGIAALPSTSGHTLGTILAYSAIAIGLAVLISQVAVRIIKRRYSK